MNDVHRIHVHPRQPIHHRLELCGNIVELEIIALNRIDLRPDLLPAELVASAVYGVKQTLGKIGARTKELHLLAHEHRRNTAGNRAIVTPSSTHQRVAFKLQCTRIDGDLRCKLAKVVRQSRRIPNREIRFRRGSQIVKSVQKTETGFRHQRPSVIAHSRDGCNQNGESPICDSYEARLMQLLDALTRTNVKRTQELPMTMLGTSSASRQSKRVLRWMLYQQRSCSFKLIALSH